MNKLYKLKEKGKLCGVCAGFSDKFGIDVTLLRIISVLLCLIDGIGLIIYFLFALLLPDKNQIIN